MDYYLSFIWIQKLCRLQYLLNTIIMHYILNQNLYVEASVPLNVNIIVT